MSRDSSSKWTRRCSSHRATGQRLWSPPDVAMVQTTDLGKLGNGADLDRHDGRSAHQVLPSAGMFVPGGSQPKASARSGGRCLRYLALNDSGIAMASSPRLSREYVRVRTAQDTNVEANRVVARKSEKKQEGRLGTAPPLLITKPQVRVLPGEPTPSRLRDARPSIRRRLPAHTGSRVSPPPSRPDSTAARFSLECLHRPTRRASRGPR